MGTDISKRGFHCLLLRFIRNTLDNSDLFVTVVIFIWHVLKSWKACNQVLVDRPPDLLTAGLEMDGNNLGDLDRCFRSDVCESTA
jgi:hypothetical protein